MNFGPPTMKNLPSLQRFPFSNLTRSTIRPTWILADTGLGDWILGQITTNAEIDSLAIELTNDNLTKGSLHTVKFVPA